MQNACPVDGCKISIDDVVRDGDEVKVTWTANFRPDFSRNHIHVYWDTFTADQVSDDAAARGVTQGSWHPTDEYPDVHDPERGVGRPTRRRRPGSASPQATATTTSSTPSSSSAPT